MKDYLMTTYHPAISIRAERRIRLAAIAMMLLVAASAVVLSFDGLRNLAMDNRVPEHLAFLFPIIIDGTITMSSLAILRMSLGGQRATFGWMVMFFGVGLSIAGNAISVRDAGVIAMLVHALPPILLAISLELLLSLIRANIKASREQASIVSEDMNVPAVEIDQQANVPAVALSEASAPPVEKTSSVEPVSISSTLETKADPEPVQAPVEFAEPQPNRQYRQVSVMAEPVENEPVNTELPAQVPVEESERIVTPEPMQAPVKDVPEQEASVDDTDFDDLFNQSVAETNDTVSPERSGSSSADVAAKGDDRLNEDMNPPKTDDVELYRRVVAGHDEWPRAKKLFAILVKYPDAKVNDIKRALGDKGNVSYSEDLAVARKALEKMTTRKVKS